MNQIITLALIFSMSVSFGQTCVASAQGIENHIFASASADNSKLKAKANSNSNANSETLIPASINPFHLNEGSTALEMKYRLPDWTYLAVFLIQDMTGRVVKTFLLDPKNPHNQNISVEDLMPGSYQYSLKLNNSRNYHGSFELPEN